MLVLGWIVWGIGCLILLVNFIIALSSRDPFARGMAARYSFLVGAGLVATSVFGLSKLHIAWWLPVAFVLNMVFASAYVNYKADQYVRSLSFRRDDVDNDQ